MHGWIEHKKVAVAHMHWPFPCDQVAVKMGMGLGDVCCGVFFALIMLGCDFIKIMQLCNEIDGGTIFSTKNCPVGCRRDSQSILDLLLESLQFDASCVSPFLLILLSVLWRRHKIQRSCAGSFGLCALQTVSAAVLDYDC